MIRTDRRARKYFTARAMSKAAIWLMLGGSSAFARPAEARPRTSAASKNNAQAWVVRESVPVALNQESPQPPPRIQIVVSPDGKNVTIKILRQDGDVTLHGALRAQPRKVDVAARAGAVVGVAKIGGSR